MQKKTKHPFLTAMRLHTQQQDGTVCTAPPDESDHGDSTASSTSSRSLPIPLSILTFPKSLSSLSTTSFSSSATAKSCSFHNEVEIIEHPADQTMNLDPRELWFQKEDIQSFRDKARELARKTDENGIGISNGKRYCMRGLEKYQMPPVGRRKRVVRKAILLAVEDGYDADFLTELSEEFNFEALQRAAADAKVANSHRKKAIQVSPEIAVDKKRRRGGEILDEFVCELAFKLSKINIGNGLMNSFTPYPIRVNR